MRRKHRHPVLPVQARHTGVAHARRSETQTTGTQHTLAAWPYVDSFTTWGAVVTTFMVARKVLENWVYWFVLDAVSIPLYAERGLYVTAMLFALYLVIIVFGFLRWHRQYAAGPDVVA